MPEPAVRDPHLHRLGTDAQQHRLVPHREPRIDRRAQPDEQVRQRGERRGRRNLQLVEDHLCGQFAGERFGQRQPGARHGDAGDAAGVGGMPEERREPCREPVAERPGECHPVDDTAGRHDELEGIRADAQPGRAADAPAGRGDVERPERQLPFDEPEGDFAGSQREAADVGASPGSRGVEEDATQPFRTAGAPRRLHRLGDPCDGVDRLGPHAADAREPFGGQRDQVTARGRFTAARRRCAERQPQRERPIDRPRDPHGAPGPGGDEPADPPPVVAGAAFECDEPPAGRGLDASPGREGERLRLDGDAFDLQPVARHPDQLARPRDLDDHAAARLAPHRLRRRGLPALLPVGRQRQHELRRRCIEEQVGARRRIRDLDRAGDVAPRLPTPGGIGRREPVREAADVDAILELPPADVERVDRRRGPRSAGHGKRQPAGSQRHRGREDLTGRDVEAVGPRVVEAGGRGDDPRLADRDGARADGELLEFAGSPRHLPGLAAGGERRRGRDASRDVDPVHRGLGQEGRQAGVPAGEIAVEPALDADRFRASHRAEPRAGA